MKTAFIKDSFKRLYKTANRFIAIMLITAIGVAFFTGLRSTAPSMEKTLDEYYQDHSFMDLKVVSTTGFSDADRARVEELSSVEVAELSKSFDAIVRLDDKSSTVRLVSYDLNGVNELNQFELVNGKLPVSQNEVLVDQVFFENNGLSLGDELVFASGSEVDIGYFLKDSSYRVVGTVYGPEFLMTERGSSFVGSGQLAGYFYLAEDSFLIPYSNMEIKIADTEGLSVFSSEYEELVGEAKASVEEELLLSHAEGSFFILDHRMDMDFVSYKGDGERIAALGLVIPILFFMIAIMVTMTSMTRLVDTDRGLIGTYKALGYGNYRIAGYYLFYAVVSSGVGGVLGVILGYSIFPKLIIGAYRSLYEFSEVKVMVEAQLVVMALLLAVSFAALPSFVIAFRRMRRNPAILMRPVVPTKGKKILIERIGPVWKRINFSHKVMLRNIFCYKKRLFMTILGVAGCTALIFAGFALRDSIKGIIDLQYGVLQKYDVSVDFAEVEGQDTLAAIYGLGGERFLEAHKDNLKLVVDGEETGISLLAFGDDSYGDFFTFRDRGSGDLLPLPDNGVLLTEKVVRDNGLVVGDTIVLKDQAGQLFEVKLGGVAENYLNHFVYVSDEAYVDLFGGEPVVNSVFVQLAPGEDEAGFIAGVLSLEGVSGVVSNSNSEDSLSSTVKTLDFVILVLILSAVALVFVVLFSLSSINIEERKRELATLKVLGFNRFEMISYIFKEIFILTLIGAVLGLLVGLFIQRYIISTMETSMMMFSREISWLSYVYSLLLTVFFAGVVNLSMFRSVTSIDMVSSLKSIE